MRLADEQLVLDTNGLIHLLRGTAAGSALDATYDLSKRSPRVIIPAVVTGELKAFAYCRNWGTAKLEKLDKLIASLPVADYASPQLVDAYARLDCLSRGLGRKMGKNDLWIAATTQVVGGVLLTTDGDFAHLTPAHVRVEQLEVDALMKGQIVLLSDASAPATDPPPVS